MLSNCFVQVLIPAINRAEIKIVYFLTFAQYLLSVLMKYDKLIWFSLCTFSRPGGGHPRLGRGGTPSLGSGLGAAAGHHAQRRVAQFYVTCTPPNRPLSECVHEIAVWSILCLGFDSDFVIAGA